VNSFPTPARISFVLQWLDPYDGLFHRTEDCVF
jgi:hypothetical protein